MATARYKVDAHEMRAIERQYKKLEWIRPTD